MRDGRWTLQAPGSASPMRRGRSGGRAPAEVESAQGDSGRKAPRFSARERVRVRRLGREHVLGASPCARRELI